MSGLHDPSMRAVYLRGLFDSCLRDLMGDQSEPALEIDTREIPDCAEQMYIHFMANAESNGLRIEPQPSWNIFNKEDESTWPPEGSDFWVYIPGRRVERSSYSRELYHQWGGVTHWMEFAAPPEPPSMEVVD